MRTPYRVQLSGFFLALGPPLSILPSTHSAHSFSSPYSPICLPCKDKLNPVPSVKLSPSTLTNSHLLSHDSDNVLIIHDQMTNMVLCAHLASPGRRNATSDLSLH